MNSMLATNVLPAQAFPHLELGADAADHFVGELGGRKAAAEVRCGSTRMDSFEDRFIDGARSPVCLRSFNVGEDRRPGQDHRHWIGDVLTF